MYNQLRFLGMFPYSSCTPSSDCGFKPNLCMPMQSREHVYRQQCLLKSTLLLLLFITQAIVFLMNVSCVISACALFDLEHYFESSTGSRSGPSPPFYSRVQTHHFIYMRSILVVVADSALMNSHILGRSSVWCCLFLIQLDSNCLCVCFVFFVICKGMFFPTLLKHNKH